MRKFETLTAIAAPLLRDNLDTDIIIRVDKLVGSNARSDLGPWCFQALRYLPDGSENPDFIFNQAPYRQAQIVLGGKNFGCGSSREGAVWAMQQMGLRCVIAPSFGDIFFNNCFQNGMLPVILAEDAVGTLAETVTADPLAHQIHVDLIAQTVSIAGHHSFSFRTDPLRRENLLAGLDEIGATLRRDGEILAFQARDRSRRPWIHHPGGG